MADTLAVILARQYCNIPEITQLQRGYHPVITRFCIESSLLKDRYMIG